MISAALFACAMRAAPVEPGAIGTLSAIVRVESGGNPLAINVNGVGPRHAATIAGVAAIARRYIAAGRTVDLGLMQINSRNLPALGYTIEDALDPCRNVAGGAAILAADYAAAARQFGVGQGALMAALSAYNTGTFTAGFANGYVAKVAGPAIPASVAISPQPRAPDPYTANTLTYSRERLQIDIE